MGEDRPPRGTGKAGRALWSSITSGFTLEAHERLVLGQAVVVADRIAQLDAVVDELGVVDVSGKVQPALTESRQQRLTLARLLTALRLPDQADERPQRRPIRGYYRPRVVSGGSNGAA